ncbi:MAG TPA: hypothetical protein PKE30_16080, partial [Niabella sp.]|nr:hypothetical protein [Niabella sp.]
MIIYRYILIIHIFLLALSSSYGQHTRAGLINVKFTSPEAQAFQQFGDIPVGKFTGVPSISIPIFVFEMKDFELPVSFKYHSSGIRVDQESTNVGLGWSLDAGGVILHNIYGKNDFELGGFLNTPYHLPNTPVSESALDYKMDSTGPPHPGGYNYFYAKKASEGEVDAQPDLFSFNFLGYAGKYYYDYHRQVHQIPLTSLKFIENYPSIKAIDPKGVHYFFNAIEHTNTSSANCGDSHTQTNYLTKILIPGIDSIVFVYDHYDYSYNVRGSIQRVALQPQSTSINLVDKDCFGSQTPSIVSVNGLRLSKIYSSRGVSVEFLYNKVRLDMANSRALSSIVVKAGNTIVKKYNLFQSYFFPDGQQPSSAAYDNSRLRLDSVSLDGLNETYSFAYNNSIEVPSKLSSARDHYGYFNGKTTNTTLLPKDIEHGFLDGADREVDSAYVQMALLKSVRYPTGGRTDFYYEPNSYFYSGQTTTTSSKDWFLAGVSNATVTKTFVIPNSVSAILNPKVKFIAVAETGGGGIGSPEENSCFVSLSGNNGYYNEWSDYNSPPAGLGLGNLSPGSYTMTITINGEVPNAYMNVTYDEVQTHIIDTNKLAGGVRIKEIKSRNNDSDPIPQVKLYQYVTDDQSWHSSGKINFPPQYTGTQVYTNVQENKTYNPVSGEMQVTGYTFTDHYYWKQLDNPFTPQTSIQGGSVGYTRVEEWLGEQAENGKTISYFSFESDNNYSDIFPMVPLVSYDWKNGLLLKELKYRKKGSVYEIVSDMENFYSVKNEEEYWNDQYLPGSFIADPYLRGWGLHIEQKNPEFNVDLTIFPARFKCRDYHFLSRWVRLDSTSSSTYGMNGQISTQNIVYNYKNFKHLLPNEILQRDSKNKLSVIINKYPQDTIADLTSAESAAINELIEQYKISFPISYKRTDGEGQVKEQVFNSYRMHSYGPVIDNIKIAYNNDPLTEYFKFIIYDTYGNILEQQKTNDVKEVYLWGYNAQCPVVKVVGSDYTTVIGQIANLQAQINMATATANNDAGV